ncbi:MAG: hypothetical protein AAF694_21855 [Bacteroidota bacterium]
MTDLIFEELVPAHFDVSDGTVELFEGASTGGFPEGPPRRIIQTDQPWEVRFTWTNSGLLVPFIQGVWHLEILLEQIGPNEFGFPAGLGKATVPFQSVNPTTYSQTIQIPQNIVPEGIYRLTACITFTSPAPASVPGPIAAFAELGGIKFYKA